MRLVRKWLFFMFDLRQCHKCAAIVGDWELLDRYPGHETGDYLHICRRCNNERLNVKPGEK